MAASTSPTESSALDSIGRERVSFNADWRFLKMDEGAPSVQTEEPGFDDSNWRKLDLPHDWGIEGPFKQEYPGETGKLPWWGTGWYRKHFRAAAEGKRVFIDFDGAMSHAQVWLNGKALGGWPYGYSSFRLELTPHLNLAGDNVIAVRLDNPPDSSRWYPGGGIYRNVWLTTTAPVHVAHWGTFVTTPRVSANSADVDVKVEIENQSGADSAIAVSTNVYTAKDGVPIGEPVASAGPVPVKIPPGVTTLQAPKLQVASPNLWSAEKPNLYVAVTTIRDGDRVIDRYETIFGIRIVEFTANNGFLLNGRRVPLNGVCNHHDLGALGAAVNTRAIERQIEILKEMGCNAIRTSHNPPAPELLQLCDRMGMLVMVEAFDCWKEAKKPNDYHTLYPEWHEKDLRAMIRRDRNHPCVILWSIGNEIPEQGRPEGPAMAKELAGYVREEDPTRPTTLACSDVRGGYNGFQKGVDVFGYNYKPWEYKKFRAANPDQPIFGSETASTISSRGEYFFPVSNNKDDGKSDFQMSSYDLFAPSWATTPDAEFKGQDENPFVAGEFVWTGFDYLGEPTPYNNDSTNLLNYHTPEAKAAAEKELKELGKIRVPSRSSYFGIIDLAGFPKDRFYIYQARWRPDFPMAHILPHWNWPERAGEVTPVHVYTSGDEAELFLNGRSQGRRKKGPFEYRLRWDEVKYEPGELKVVTMKNGKPWAQQTMVTTGPAAKIALAPDRARLTADGRDLSFVTVSIVDAQGRTVPRTGNLVQFEISGPGEIVAVDNGDATSHESFQSKECKAFNGLCMVIVRTQSGAVGKIRIKASSAGLESSEASLEVSGGTERH